MITEIEDIPFNVDYRYHPGCAPISTIKGDPGDEGDNVTIEDIEMVADFSGTLLENQVFIINFDELPDGLRKIIYEEIIEHERR